MESSLAAIVRELLTDRLLPTDAIGSTEAVYNSIVDRLRCASSLPDHQLIISSTAWSDHDAEMKLLIRSTDQHDPSASNPSP